MIDEDWYKSGHFPENFYTRTQLRKKGLKPAPNQKPAGYWHRQCYHADIELWDARDAIPLRKCSPAQLQALAKARAKIGEAARREAELRERGETITLTYKDCMIELRPEGSYWVLLVTRGDEVWRFGLLIEWHEVCLRIGQAFVDNAPSQIEGNIFHMENSYFFRSHAEEECKRRELLKKLPDHCPNCGEPIAALMLDCPHCEVSYSAGDRKV